MGAGVSSQSTYALKQDGSVWTWGYNFYGELGDQTTVYRSSPVLVVGNHSFVEIAGGGNHAIARKSDGSVWAWGSNSNGQLGDNTASTSRSSPVLVVGNHSFIEIDSGSTYTIARKSDGSVWTWGTNFYGQLGDQTTISKSSPVLVVGNHSFVETIAGDFCAITRKSDGSVWSWGRNESGQLGDETITSKSSPILVVGNHSFIEIDSGFSHAIARKSDGSVWAWGYNLFGQLGDNTKVDKSSPVLVVGNHSFVEIKAGTSSYSVIARKSDGSVWAWGSNSNGQLGDETVEHRSSPVLVVGNHSFIEIDSGSTYTIARKSDGSVWAWGNNFYGDLGDGTIASKSSPILVVGSHVFAALSEIIIAGSTCWGHDTGVTQTNIRNFGDSNWQGTGTIEGSDDAETLGLSSGQSEESEVVNTGAVVVTILRNHYQRGD